MPLCPHCRHLNPVGNPRCAKCDRWISLDPEPASSPTLAAPSEPAPATEAPTDVIPIVDEWEQSLLDLLRANRKIDAIKLVRERFGSSLLDAKNYVEGLPLGAASPKQRDLSEEVREVLQKSGKIAAIKLYRERTDKGFAEAQQAVEAIAEGRSPTFGGGNPDEALLELLRAGRQIEAIRLCRQQSGRGLLEAKQYVEDLGRRHGVKPKAAGCGTAALVLLASTVAITLLAVCRVASAW
jgi:ribosomal protein L7/L12